MVMKTIKEQQEDYAKELDEEIQKVIAEEKANPQSIEEEDQALLELDHKASVKYAKMKDYIDDKAMSVPDEMFDYYKKKGYIK